MIDLATPYPFDTFIDAPALTNEGTIEVASGTVIYPSASLGTSSVQAGSTLKIDANATLSTEVPVAITEIDGTVILGGAESSFPDLAALATIDGTFRVLSGATFSTTGDLTNAGTLSVGGSLTVNGALTQSQSTSVLDFPVGAAAGTPGAPNLTVTGATTLAGDLTAEFAGGFAAGSASNYTVASFASAATGSFASVAGTAPDFTPTVVPTSIVLGAIATASSDLAVTSVSAPGTFSPGAQETVTWNVTNMSASTTASWVDSVYLIPQRNRWHWRYFSGERDAYRRVGRERQLYRHADDRVSAAAGSYKVVVVWSIRALRWRIRIEANNVGVSGRDGQHLADAFAWRQCHRFARRGGEPDLSAHRARWRGHQHHRGALCRGRFR